MTRTLAGLRSFCVATASPHLELCYTPGSTGSLHTKALCSGAPTGSGSHRPAHQEAIVPEHGRPGDRVLSAIPDRRVPLLAVAHGRTAVFAWTPSSSSTPGGCRRA